MLESEAERRAWKPSWKVRVGAVVAACVLALALLEVWAAGVRFMHLVARVASQVAETEARAAAERDAAKQGAQASDTPGVVTVGIVPEAKKTE